MVPEVDCRAVTNCLDCYVVLNWDCTSGYMRREWPRMWDSNQRTTCHHISIKSEGAFLEKRPNPILHFAPFFVHLLFPVFETPYLKMGLCCPSSPLCLSSSLARTTTLELPECQERRGANMVRVFRPKAGDAFTRTRICPFLGFQPPFLLNIAGRDVQQTPGPSGTQPPDFWPGPSRTWPEKNWPK